MAAFEGPARKAINFIAISSDHIPTKTPIFRLLDSTAAWSTPAPSFTVSGRWAQAASSLVAQMPINGSAIRSPIGMTSGSVKGSRLILPLYTEHYDGRDKFVAELKRSRRRFCKRKAPGIGFCTRTSLIRVSFSTRSLPERRWTLHMLRAQMGMDSFSRPFGNYKRSRQQCTTDDLRA